MPHSQRSVSASRSAAPVKPTRAVASGRGRSTPASKSVQFASKNHRKTRSAPGKFTTELEKSGVNQESLTSSIGGDDYLFDAEVKDNAITSRAASPSSSFSSSNTLTSNSDTSSNTFVNPPSTSNAARRNKFKEEFGSASYSVAQPDADFKPTKVIDATVQSTSSITAKGTEITYSAKNHISTFNKKQAKNRFRKKPARSYGTDLDFTYRNTYVASTGNTVSAHFGCVVM